MNGNKSIGLALSGGGVRAAIFHLGVLEFLAHRRLLEDISVLSTVSGGSLVTGLIYASNNYEWPSSDKYVKSILPQVKNILTTKALLSSKRIPALFLRHPVLMMVKRANLVAKQLQSQWGIAGSIRGIAPKPKWFINTTSYESGKNWRFSQNHTGDWKFGRNFEADFSLAEALAASAAVPYLIGALHLKLPEQGWQKTDPATGHPLGQVVPKKRKVRLWDGGVYENLGLETLYKPGRGAIDCDRIIISDAGAPLRPTWTEGSTPLLGSPRLFDLTSDQVRSLRARQIMEFFRGEGDGIWIPMGKCVEDFSRDTGAELDVKKYLDRAGVDKVARVGTHLNKVSGVQFETIRRHGLEAARMTTDFFL
jgi:NTE family protein